MQMYGDRNEQEERQVTDLQYSPASILDHNNMFNSFNDESHLYYPLVMSDLDFSRPSISLDENSIQNRNSMEFLFDTPCALYSRKNSLVLPCNSTTLFNYESCFVPIASNDPSICFSTFENNSEVSFNTFSYPQDPQDPQDLQDSQDLPENNYYSTMDNNQCEVSTFNTIQAIPSINLPLPDFLCNPNELNESNESNESNEFTEIAEFSEITRGNEAEVELDSSSGSSELSDFIESRTLKRHSWTRDECQRLMKAVSMYGSSGHWKEVSKFVGSRSEGQCINKWKNDLCKTKKRWNKEATKRLLAYLRKGLDREEIFQKMSDYTYIQVYQQIQKHNTNQQPWEEWEIKKLIELKKRGEKEAAIGRLLNNRHRDAVRNMWNKVKSN